MKAGSGRSVLFAILLLAGALATTSPRAAERWVSQGVYVYWGNVIDAPFRIAETDSDFVVKGLRLPRPESPSEPPRPVTLDSNRAREFRLAQRVFADAERDRARGAPQDTIVARALRTLQTASIVRKAEIMDAYNINVLWTFGDGEYLVFHPPTSPEEFEAGRVRHLDGLAEALQKGYVVVEGGGCTIFLRMQAGSDVTRLLEQFRAGERNAFAGHPKLLEESLLHPRRLERVKK